MTNWLTGCPVDRLTDWLTDWLADWLAEWLTDWLTDWLTGWPTNWLTDWLADWLTDWLTDRLTDWLTDWQARWQAGWLINWIYNIVSYWESDKLTYSEMLNDYRPNLPVHTLGFLIGGLRARTIPWFFGHFWKCSEVVDNYEKSRDRSCSEPFNWFIAFPFAYFCLKGSTLFFTFGVVCETEKGNHW